MASLPLLRDAVIDQPAHHARRRAVVKDQPVEAQHIPQRNRVGIQHLRVGVHVNLDGRWILQRRGLPGLHRQDEKQVVRGERDAIHRESPLLDTPVIVPLIVCGISVMVVACVYVPPEVTITCEATETFWRRSCWNYQTSRRTEDSMAPRSLLRA